MADWKGKARSNYFEVKDEFAFNAWAERRQVTVAFKLRDIGKRKDVRTVAIFANTEDGSWPTYSMAEDDDVDFVNEVSDHLIDGEVVVLMEVGSEKSCYVTGVAQAFDIRGRESLVRISLDDIYLAAATQFGITVADISDCTY